MSPERPIVVDASVAVKWVIKEEYSEQAEALYEAVTRSRQPIMVPPHFAGEVVNALYRRTRRAEEAYRITEQEAERATERFLGLEVGMTSPAGLYLDALRFAG